MLSLPALDARSSWGGGSGSSLDDLGRLLQDGLWDGHAKCLGGLQVDQDVGRVRELDRQVARLCALEDLVDVASGPPDVRQCVGTRGQQAAVDSEHPVLAVRRLARPQRYGGRRIDPGVEIPDTALPGWPEAGKRQKAIVRCQPDADQT